MTHRALCEIVDDRYSPFQRSWGQYLFDVDREALSVDWPVEQRRRLDPFAAERSISTWEAEAKCGSTYEQLPALIQVKWHDIRHWRINPSGVPVRKTVLPLIRSHNGAAWEVVKESR